MATKLQITITDQEKAALKKKAEILGYDVTKFVKFLLSREAYEHINERVELEKMVKKAHNDHEQGKTHRLSSIDDIDSV